MEENAMVSQPNPITETAAAPQMLDSARFHPADRKRLSAPSLRSFLAIADLWRLKEEQRRLILGYPSRSTYHNWCREARRHVDITLNVDVLMRISAILSIHQDLGILFASEDKAVEWLRGPHLAPLFGGQSPLDLITSGNFDSIMLVKRFLDGAKGGIYMAPSAIDNVFKPYIDRDIVFT